MPRSPVRAPAAWLLQELPNILSGSKCQRQRLEHFGPELGRREDQRAGLEAMVSGSLEASKAEQAFRSKLGRRISF